MANPDDIVQQPGRPVCHDDVRVQANNVVASLRLLTAKLDADAGVSDTNYSSAITNDGATFAPYHVITVPPTSDGPVDTTELGFLRANIAGGDTTLRAVYSARYGLTVDGDELTQWDDARGTGFAPSIAVGGYPADPDVLITQGYQVINPDDPATRLIRSGSDRGMTTQASNVFNLRSAKCLVVVMVDNPTLGDTTERHPVQLQGRDDVVGNTPIFSIGECQLGNVPGSFRFHLFDAAPNNNVSPTAQGQRRLGPKMRVFTASLESGSYAWTQDPHMAIDHVLWESTTITSAAPLSNEMVMMLMRDAYADIRAILMLDRTPTDDDLATLAEWGATYHNAVINTPMFAMADGDSLTHGGAAGDIRQGWFDNLMSRSGFEAVEDINYGSGGSYIGVITDSFSSSCKTRQSSILASFALSSATSKVISIMAGTNDISFHTSLTVDDLETRMWDVVDPYVADGVRVLLGTVPANGIHDATQDTLRQTFNDRLRAGWESHGCFALIDWAALPQFDELADTADTTYYQADTTHQNAVGCALLADEAEPYFRAALGLPALPAASDADIDDLVTTLEATATVRAFYDTRRGVTAAASAATQWDDVRGATGFGPSFTASGAQSPVWDDTAKTLKGDGSAVLFATAADAAFDLSAGVTIFYIGTAEPNATTDNHVLFAINDQPTFSRLLHCRTLQSGGGIDAVETSRAVGSASTVTPDSTTMRLIVVTAGALAVTLATVDETAISGFGSPTGSGNNQMFLFGDRPSFVFSECPNTVKAILVLDGEATTDQITAVETWAVANHSVVAI